MGAVKEMPRPGAQGGARAPLKGVPGAERHRHPQEGPGGLPRGKEGHSPTRRTAPTQAGAKREDSQALRARQKSVRSTNDTTIQRSRVIPIQLDRDR